MKTSVKLMGAFALAAALAFNCHGVILNYGGVFKFAGANKAFADACANEVLDRMGPRAWLITDGLLDKALRKAAVARGQELNIICIKLRSEAECKAYCNRLADLVAEKKLTAGGKSNADLVFTLRELGLLPFLKVWFKNDPNIMNEVMTIGWPDIWFWANCRPVPDGLGFRGVKDVSSVDGLKIKSDFEALWKKLEPSIVIPRYSGKGSYSIREVEEDMTETDRRRMELRRYFGLIANNIGVLLQDLHHDKEAFEMYELVLGTIDCDNICALFNEFEMIRVGNQVAMGRRREVQQQLKAIIDDQTRRYRIGSLSSYYGYIRSSEFLVRNGIGWARSGEAGYSIANLKYASDLVPGGKPSTELLNLMAGFYAQSSQVEKSRETYQEVLSKDATNYDALMGLWRLSLQEGAIEEAKDYLKRAVDAPTNGETVRFEVPLMHMMDNNLVEARLALQKITDHQPSIQAWALLAGVVLQLADSATDPKQKILAEVENVILPKMEGLASSPRDFYVQMTRALTLMRKGTDPDTLKRARAALEIAWMSRPMVSVGGMVLDLDYRLLDREGAERHALQILRMDEKHVFANWVMGSIRMGEDRLPEAERYLRASAQAAHPLPAAQNDLAELLRRRGNLAEAEEFARAATKSDPKLYVAWETLASTLLDRGNDLDEAERHVNTAIKLAGKKDKPRMKLTLVRVQLAKKEINQARTTLREINERREYLDDRDRAVLDELLKKVMDK